MLSRLLHTYARDFFESVLTTSMSKQRGFTKFSSMSKQRGFTKFSVFLKRVSLQNPRVRSNFVAFSKN